MDAELVPVSEQDFEAGEILRGGDDQDVPDSGVHQNGNGIIDHRLVIDREKLFGCDHCQRIEPGAGAAGEYYAFHEYLLSSTSGDVRAPAQTYRVKKQHISAILYPLQGMPEHVCAQASFALIIITHLQL
jgi:hypothetical protein